MAFVNVQNVAVNVPAAQPSATFNFPSFTNTAGNILIFVSREGGAPGVDRVSTVADSNGNTWTQVVLSGNGTLWYAANCNSGPNIVTVTNTNTNTHLQAIVGEYSGVATVAPFDTVSITSSGSGTVATSNSITTSKGSELLIGFGSNGTTNTPGITAGAGYSLRVNVNCFLEDSTAGAAGSYTSSATYSGSVGWGQYVAAFLPAASGSKQRTLVGVGL